MSEESVERAAIIRILELANDAGAGRGRPRDSDAGLGPIEPGGPQTASGLCLEIGGGCGCATTPAERGAAIWTPWGTFPLPLPVDPSAFAPAMARVHGILDLIEAPQGAAALASARQSSVFAVRGVGDLELRPVEMRADPQTDETLAAEWRGPGGGLPAVTPGARPAPPVRRAPVAPTTPAQRVKAATDAMRPAIGRLADEVQAILEPLEDAVWIPISGPPPGVTFLVDTVSIRFRRHHGLLPRRRRAAVLLRRTAVPGREREYSSLVVSDLASRVPADARILSVTRPVARARERRLPWPAAQREELPWRLKGPTLRRLAGQLPEAKAAAHRQAIDAGAAVDRARRALGG